MTPAATTAVAEVRKTRPGMSDHWELDAALKRGIFKFRPHGTNYLIGTYTYAPNDEAYRPFRRLTADEARLAHSELVFQLGFKMKLVENAFSQPVDLWFGYKQNSFWQADNEKASSPFRETNYQPELIATVPLGFDGAWRERALPQSWFRAPVERAGVDAVAQLEPGVRAAGPGAAIFRSPRAWKRLKEPLDDDDNPDISKYMGHGDIVAVYRDRGHKYSALVRRNLHRTRAQSGSAGPGRSRDS
jgi:phospholipase A1